VKHVTSIKLKYSLRPKHT